MEQKGQTLLEGIIAIFVILTGVIGALVLALSAFSSSVESEDQIKATNFAREGLEVIRNQRDTNWLAQADFDEGLKSPSTGGTYHNIYVQFESLPEISWTIYHLDSGFNDPFNCSGGSHSCQLFYDTDGYYNHSENNNPTNFYQVLRLNFICRESGAAQNLYIEQDGDPCEGGETYKAGIEVLSKVSWLENGQERTIILEDRLFNWR